MPSGGTTKVSGWTGGVYAAGVASGVGLAAGSLFIKCDRSVGAAPSEEDIAGASGIGEGTAGLGEDQSGEVVGLVPSMAGGWEGTPKGLSKADNGV